MKEEKFVRVEQPIGRLYTGYLSRLSRARHILVELSGFSGYFTYDRFRKYEHEEPLFEAGVALCGFKTPRGETGIWYELETIDELDPTLCKKCVAKWIARGQPVKTVFWKKRRL